MHFMLLYQQLLILASFRQLHSHLSASSHSPSCVILQLKAKEKQTIGGWVNTSFAGLDMHGGRGRLGEKQFITSC